MKKCPKCGAVNADNGSRCVLCGKTLKQVEIIYEEAEREALKQAESQVELQLSGNTSGQGKLAVIPDEIRGWNWGAFLLTWILGFMLAVLGAKALILYVVLAIPFMSVVLGMKGNEWAWRSQKWDSIDHFKRTQRKWAWWALGVAALPILFFLFAAFGWLLWL